MNLIWYVIVGLIAGVLAKAIMPGNRSEPSGCFMTMALGIVGSLLTGFVVHRVLHETTKGGFVGSIVGATIGAIVVIAIGRSMSGRR